MHIYNVGEKELPGWDLGEIDPEKFEWFVYEYDPWGQYEADGQGVAYGKDGFLYCKDLGHCSCYTAMCGWQNEAIKMTVEEFIRDKDSIFDYTVSEAVLVKVKELIQPRSLWKKICRGFWTKKYR